MRGRSVAMSKPPRIEPDLGECEQPASESFSKKSQSHEWSFRGNKFQFGECGPAGGVRTRTICGLSSPGIGKAKVGILLVSVATTVYVLGLLVVSVIIPYGVRSGRTRRS